MPDGFTKSEQTCCICLPLATGMKVLGWLTMIEGVFMFAELIYIFVMNPIAGIITALIFILPIIMIVRWFKWLRDDNEETTKGVVGIMFVMFVFTVVVGLLFAILMSYFIGAFFYLLLGLSTADESGQATADVATVGAGIYVAIWADFFIKAFLSWYFYNATKRYYQDRHVQFASNA